MRRAVILIAGIAVLGGALPAGASAPRSAPPGADQEVTVDDLAAAAISFVGAAGADGWEELADSACTIREGAAVCYATHSTGVIRGDAPWTSDKTSWSFTEFAPPSGEAATGESAAGERGTRDNPTPLGVAAPVGYGWTAVVNAVNLDGTDVVLGANQFNDPPIAGSQYVIANVTVIYNGSEASDSGGVRFDALGASNVTMRAGGSTYAVPPTPLESFTEVFQGGSLTGDIVFEVPTTDIDSLVLIGHALMSFDDTERSFFATS